MAWCTVKPAVLQNHDGWKAFRFTPYQAPTVVTTGAVVEGLEHHHSAVGVLDFELEGSTLQLVVFGKSADSLQVLFTDANSGRTT
jgi:uncharacterized protein